MAARKQRASNYAGKGALTSGRLCGARTTSQRVLVLDDRSPSERGRGCDMSALSSAPGPPSRAPPSRRLGARDGARWSGSGSGRERHAPELPQEREELGLLLDEVEREGADDPLDDGIHPTHTTVAALRRCGRPTARGAVGRGRRGAVGVVLGRADGLGGDFWELALSDVPEGERVRVERGARVERLGRVLERERKVRFGLGVRRGAQL